MRLIKKEEFSFEGRNYEIRLYGKAWDFMVQVFSEGRPANGYKYSVSLPTDIDLINAHNFDAVRILLDIAKQDIENKVWERYVEVYVNNLHKTSKESLGCRNCGSREIAVATVDQREMFECSQCRHIWYSTRISTSGPLSIIDEITEGVAKNGSHEIQTEILLNFIFREEDNKDLSFEDQLANWANQNRLEYNFFRKGGTHYVRFWR